MLLEPNVAFAVARGGLPKHKSADRDASLLDYISVSVVCPSSSAKPAPLFNTPSQTQSVIPGDSGGLISFISESCALIKSVDNNRPLYARPAAGPSAI